MVTSSWISPTGRAVDNFSPSFLEWSKAPKSVFFSSSVGSWRGLPRAEVEVLRPDLVIPVGTLAITEVTGHRGRLVDVIGQTVPVTLFGHETEAIPLPHPSGASTWFKTEPGAALTARALNLLARHPAMRDALA